MADGLDLTVYESSVCKVPTQDLNFLLNMHSCRQGSGTAAHLSLFFFWFSSLLKTSTLLASPNVDDVFLRFSLRSRELKNHDEVYDDDVC